MPELNAEAQMEKAEHSAEQERVEALKGPLEALLFVAAEPMPPSALAEALGERGSDTVRHALRALARDFELSGRGLLVEEAAGGFRLVTKAMHDGAVRRLLAAQQSRKLTRAALEALAIVAYRQPVTAPEVEAIRGVDSMGVLQHLLERRLIKIAGRKEVVGRPFLWRTTKQFLEHFGLRALEDLPSIEEFEALLPPLSGEEGGPTLFARPAGESEGEEGGEAPEPLHLEDLEEK
jgi:segregation and condensation protein B